MGMGEGPSGELSARSWRRVKFPLKKGERIVLTFFEIQRMKKAGRKTVDLVQEHPLVRRKIAMVALGELQEAEISTAFGDDPKMLAHVLRLKRRYNL